LNLHARSLWTLIGVLFLASVGGCEKEKPPEQRAAPPVSVITVAPTTIPFVSTFVAQTQSSHQVDIVARVSGYLDKIAYQEGELVKQGQLLFVIDSKPFQAQIDGATGELRAQQARLATATANLNRIKPLAEMNAVSRADLDRAQGEFDASNAAVFAAQAKLKEATLNIGYTSIRSPVTGQASRAKQREGAYINSMSEMALLTYVAVVDPVWVAFSVSQNQLAQFKDQIASGQIVVPETGGYEVELVMPDGSAYSEKGRIDFADPSFSQDTGSFMVRAIIPNPRKALRPGMIVTAKLKGATRPNAIVVPQLAVQQGPNGHLVYVIRPDGIAEVRPVVVGSYEGDKDIVIVTGLKAGDRVVTEGVLKVVPGKPVQVTAAAADTAAEALPKAAEAPKQ